MNAGPTRRPTTKAGSASSRPLLHRKPSRLVDRFEEEANRCASEYDLRRLLDQVTSELGFHFFALLHHESLAGNRRGLVRIDNYPEDWALELSSGLAADDPVHRASVRTNAGFRWTEVGELIEVTARQRAIFERSARHGIGLGFTIPANVPGEPSGSFSFAVRKGRRLPAHRLLCAELIGAHAFRIARRLHGLPRRGLYPHLSRRELECLRLVAAGKSDWEIARILGIGADTARQYVKRARAAYDVVSRTQLVVHGLRDARIGFDDAIPPDG